MRDRVKIGVTAVVPSLRRPRWSHSLEERPVWLPARRVLLALLVWLFTVIPAASVSAQDNTPLPEAPPYVLLPPDWPYPAVPTCGTPYGVCRYPKAWSPGTPCFCLAANGVWVSGHILVNIFPSPLPRPGQ